MIIEIRTYTIDPHKIRPWLGIWQEKALPIQLGHIAPLGGAFLGMYMTEFGALNEAVHLWQHVDTESRAQMRRDVESDPRWPEYLRAVNDLAPILGMRSSLLRPTAFSPQSLAAQAMPAR